MLTIRLVGTIIVKINIRAAKYKMLHLDQMLNKIHLFIKVKKSYKNKYNKKGYIKNKKKYKCKIILIKARKYQVDF